MDKKYEMPVWERISESKDDFDLRLINPKKVNLVRLKELLKKVEDADQTVGLNKRVSKAFLLLFDNPEAFNLPEYAYAIIQNWFKNENKRFMKSPRRGKAKEFWEALFCAVPNHRLTYRKTGMYEQFDPSKYKLWWEEQIRCQSNNRLK